MILEGIVTTLGTEGDLNVAPMGPRVEADMRQFVLRPFQTSTTYRNLKATRQGVFHVTDDVLMIARAAIGEIHDAATRPASVVSGQILLGSCRYYEFRVTDLDDREERTTITVETVAEGRLRDFFGLNRAKHAVVEAAILATRAAILPAEEIFEECRKLAVLVEKTGGPAERQAFQILWQHVKGVADPSGVVRGANLL